jgi:pentatricopeptide repeat protein
MANVTMTNLKAEYSDSLSEVLALVADPDVDHASSSFKMPPSAKVVQNAARRMLHSEGTPSQSVGNTLQSLKSRIFEAEKEVESSISTLQARSDSRLDTYRKFSSNVIAMEESEMEIKELQEEGVNLYLKSVAQRNVELSQLRREDRLRSEHVDMYATEHFEWFAIIQTIYELLLTETYAEKAWRAQVYSKISALEAVIRAPKQHKRNKKTGGGEVDVADIESSMEAAIRDVALDLDNFLENPSGRSARQIEEELRSVSSVLMGLEAKLDPAFDTIRTAKEDTASRRAEANARWTKGAPGGNTPAGLAHQVIDQRRNQAQERLLAAKEALPPPATPPEPDGDPEGDDSVTRQLFEAGQVVAFRGNEAALATQYHHIMVWCAHRGDWRGAFKVYHALSDRHLPARYPLTFTTLLLAAKNAKPHAATQLVVPVMEEAETCGFALTREVFHAAIDVCRAGGHWRRALGVFNRMSAAGIAPSTHTYALLEQAGAAARGAEPAEVYEAMTFAGVPAYLSYTAAAARALNRAPLDEGPTADWIGASVIPFTGLGAVHERTANLAGGLSSTAGRSVSTIKGDGTVSRTRQEPAGPSALNTSRRHKQLPAQRRGHTPQSTYEGKSGSSKVKARDEIGHKTNQRTHEVL